jgi:hypothetical protein
VAQATMDLWLLQASNPTLYSLIDKGNSMCYRNFPQDQQDSWIDQLYLQSLEKLNVQYQELLYLRALHHRKLQVMELALDQLLVVLDQPKEKG